MRLRRLSEGVQQSILKAEVLSYGIVFGYAAFSVLVGAFTSLFFFRTTTGDTERMPEVRAEASAGG